MKTKKVIFLGVTLLLTISLMLPLGCTKETEVSTPTEFKTFSKYGFSFEYLKRFTVAEMGMLENEATDSSGLVQVGVENELFQTVWIGMIESTWSVTEDLQGSLDDSFAGMVGEGVASVDRGELVETTKAGHQILYQYYILTPDEGDKAYGIVGIFYCDKSQRLFQLMTMNTTISAKQDVLEDFQNYLDSFVCH